MRTHRSLKSRKGAAIEMAIMVMVVSVSLSIVILTVSLLQHDKQLRAEEEMARGITLEQIGEDFCTAVPDSQHLWVTNYPDYNITINGLEMTVTEKDSETVLLEISLENNGGVYRILRWDAR